MVKVNIALFIIGQIVCFAVNFLCKQFFKRKKRKEAEESKSPVSRRDSDEMSKYRQKPPDEKPSKPISIIEPPDEKPSKSVPTVEPTVDKPSQPIVIAEDTRKAPKKEINEIPVVSRNGPKLSPIEWRRTDYVATRWGIVTAGKICHDFVCVLRSLPKDEHKVVAIAARNTRRAGEFAQEHGIPKVYSTYEELAKDDEVEVVYVGTITPLHLAVGKLFLKAGKHVLMEKPMAMNMKQTLDLIETARQHQRFLMEALWSRFFPAYEKLIEELKSGTIGEIFYVNATFGTYLEKMDRVGRKEFGGGTILDLGIYCVNAVSMVYEGMKPKRIAAVGHLNSNGVDENMSASLLYDGKRIASIATSAQGRLPCQLIVCGTKGILKLPYPMWCPTSLHTPHDKYHFPLPETVVKCHFTNSSGLRYEAEEVRECIQKGLLESPRMSHSDSLLLAVIMEEIRKQLGVMYNDS